MVGRERGEGEGEGDCDDGEIEVILFLAGHLPLRCMHMSVTMHCSMTVTNTVITSRCPPPVALERCTATWHRLVVHSMYPVSLHCLPACLPARIIRISYFLSIHNIHRIRSSCRSIMLLPHCASISGSFRAFTTGAW